MYRAALRGLAGLLCSKALHVQFCYLIFVDHLQLVLAKIFAPSAPSLLVC